MSDDIELRRVALGFVTAARRGDRDGVEALLAAAADDGHTWHDVAAGLAGVADDMAASAALALDIDVDELWRDYAAELAEHDDPP